MSERPRRTEITDPVEITVDGRPITAQSGELLIDACERNGTYIPRFCYHPRMTPVGMCRMCIVEVDSGRGSALQPSCMVPVTPGTVVDTTSDTVAKVQDGVLEFLLANHPLDCPVCDKGGECPLQDQAYSFGPGESRFVEEKRHFAKPIAISETVYLDRERCILCDRCTRFADEVAGDPLIHFIGRGSVTEVNTFPGEPFASYFSGNTVQICPVGALTARPYRFKARPWDLQEVESTCTRCSVGCRITVESSRNEVLRSRGVDSDPVNWSWLCDKGRFGFEAFNSRDRLREPLLRTARGDGTAGGELAPARWSDALGAVADAIRAAAGGRGPSSVAVLGGARLTNEGQYAWTKLAKAVIGTDNVDAQVGDGLPAEMVLGLPGASIDDVCAPGGTVLWIGPDPKEELPVLFLRLKHAAQRDGVTLVEVSPRATGLSPYASHVVGARPGQLAGVLRSLFSGTPASDQVAAAEALRNAAMAQDGASDGLRVVIGRPNLAESADAVVDAISVLREAAPGARYLAALPRANVRGALEAGMAPGLLPGGQQLGSDTVAAAWPAQPDQRGLDAAGILDAAASGRIDVLVLLGADPLADFPDRSLARRALTGARTVISVDALPNQSTAHARIVLPAAAFAELDGTTTSSEGRVTRLAQKVTPPGTARADWMIALDLAARLGTDLGVSHGETDLFDELCRVSPAHSHLSDEVVSDPEHADGILVDLAARELPFTATSPDMPAPDAYALRLVVDRTLYDRGTLLTHSPSSRPLAPPAVALLSPADAAPLGITDGTRIELTSEHGSISLPARPDASVTRGAVVVHHALEGADPGSLVRWDDPVCDVRIDVMVDVTRDATAEVR